MCKRIKTMLSVLFVFLLFNSNIGRAGEIHDVVENQDLEKVKVLIEGHSELLNKQDQDAKTPLHHAIEKGNTAIAKYLIAQGADLNLKDKEDDSPLHYAAIEGNREIAGILLEKGTVSINEGNFRQMTPLHFACERGHPEVLTLLLDYGADIEAKDQLGRTLLMCAAASRNIEVVHILVEKGADINVRVPYRGNEYTALTLAAMYGFRDFVDYLIDQQADIPESSVDLTLQHAVQRDYVRLYEYLQENGLSVTEMKDNNPALIHTASANGSIEIVESLIEHGFDLNQKDEYGWRPLHHAASEGQIEMIKYLIGGGVDKNARTKMGETAYNLAASRSFRKAADYLQKVGGDSSEPQFPELTGPYMGQEPPGDKPEMFLPGIVSNHYRAHSSIIFSPDGTEAYWTDMGPLKGNVTEMRIEGNKWTCPKPSVMERDPSFSPDGSRLFFIKLEPLKEGEKPAGDLNYRESFCYMERTASGWSEPKSVGEVVNSLGIHWPCAIDKEGNLYFSEFAHNMYRSQYQDGEYQEAVNLTEFCANETLQGCSPFISPDADYLLFVNEEELHVSFKKRDGTWTNRINLGHEINASRVNGSPRVTPDGKYLFFVSAGKGRPWGIYWVSSQIIHDLKKEHLKDN